MIGFPKRTFKAGSQREIELDFIRGIAILLVIDLHNKHGLLRAPLALIAYPHVGWIGVNIFFVLSGFLVGGLLMKEWKVRKGIDSKRFLIRRVLKIWPQYYFFLAISMIFGSFTLRYAWGNLFNVQNYFTGGIGHTWSLAVEEHVYLMLLVFFSIAARWSIALRKLFLFLCGVCAFEILLRYILESRGRDVYFVTHTRVDGILYGVLLAMLYHFAPERFDRLRSYRLFWIGCVIVGLACQKVLPQQAFHIDGANLIAIAILLLLYNPPAESRQRGLLYRTVAQIGLYSYGIYIWHVNAAKPIFSFGIRHPHTPGWILGVAFYVAAIGLGIVTTTLVEFPMLRLRDRLFPRRIDSAVGIPAELEAPAGAPPSLEPAS
jgi:peptidoglycan/LPS O-acetylase OafA/YrhL